MNSLRSWLQVAVASAALGAGTGCGGEFVGVSPDGGGDDAAPDGGTQPDAPDGTSADGTSPDVTRPDAIGPDGTGPKDTNPPPPIGPCPTSPPMAGSTCSPVGIECEWGTNLNPPCNTVDNCETGGWVTQPGDPTCAMTVGTCPATYALVPQGSPCPSDENGLVCGYPRGECFCEMNIEVSAGGPAWDCSSLAKGCPAPPRPDIGTVCTDPGLTCDYGACLGGIALVCQMGYWQEAEEECPG